MRERLLARDTLGLIVALALCFAMSPVIPMSGLVCWVFASMAVGVWLVWRKVGFAGGRLPLGLFAVQFALQLAYWLIMRNNPFGMESASLALAVIVVLWLSILSTLIAFCRVSLPAGVLMVPILLWVTALSYATLWAAAWSHPGAH